GRRRQSRKQGNVGGAGIASKERRLYSAVKVEERGLLGRQRGGDSKSDQNYQDEAFHLRSLDGRPQDRAGWPPINVNRRRGICLRRFADRKQKGTARALGNQVRVARGVREIEAQQGGRLRSRPKAPVAGRLQRDVCKELAARRCVERGGG